MLQVFAWGFFLGTPIIGVGAFGLILHRIHRARYAHVSQARLHEILVHTRNMVNISWGITWDICLFGHIARVVKVKTGEPAINDPVCNTVARTLGFTNVSEGIGWNDSSERCKLHVLARLDDAIRVTAPLPRDPLAGAQGRLAANDPPSIQPSEIERTYIGV